MTANSGILKSIFLTGMAVLLLAAACQNPLVGLGPRVDLDPPTGTIGGPFSGAVASGDYVSGNIHLQGTVQDDTGVQAVWAVINGQQVNGTVNTSNGTWDIPVDTAAPEYGGDGAKNFKIYLQDTSGRVSDPPLSMLLYFDNTPSAIMVTSPHIGYVQNRQTIVLKGEAYDPLQLEDVWIEKIIFKQDGSSVITTLYEHIKYDADGNINHTPGTDVLGGGEILNSGTPDTWLFSITHGQTGAGKLSVVLSARDMAGNEGRTVCFYQDLVKVNNNAGLTVADLYNLLDPNVDPADLAGLTIQPSDFSNTYAAGFLPSQSLTLKLTSEDSGPVTIDALPLMMDMSGDNPVITMLRPEEDGSTTLGEGGTIYGSISDNVELNDNNIIIEFEDSVGTVVHTDTLISDDGGSVPGAHVHVIDAQNVNFSYPLPSFLPDGDYKVKMVAEDVQVPPKQSALAPVPFKINKAVPNVTLTTVQGEAVSTSRTEYLKDTAGNLEGTITSSSTGKIVIKYDGTNQSPEITYNELTTNWSFALSALPAGTTSVDITATNDHTGLSSADRVTLILDTAVPVLEFIDPPETEMLKDFQDLRISVSDNEAIEEFTYTIGNDPSLQGVVDSYAGGVPQYTSSQGTVSGRYSATVRINTLLYQNPSAASDNGDGTWDIPIKIELKDKAGNTAAETKTYTIRNVPPEVSIIYPVEDKMYNGAVTVSGSAIDDSGKKVDWVKARIDVTTPPGGTPDFSTDLSGFALGAVVDVNGLAPGGDEPFNNESTEFTLDGQSSWEFTLNKSGKLYDTDGAGGHEGDIWVKVWARDQINGLENTAVNGKTNPSPNELDVYYFHFVLNNSAPVAAITGLPGTDGYISSKTGNITGNLTGDGANTLEISLDSGASWQDVPGSPFADPVNTAWTYDISAWPGVLAEGAHTVMVKATSQGTGFSGFDQKNFMMDTTAPVLHSYSPGTADSIKNVVNLRVTLKDNGELDTVTRKIGSDAPVSLTGDDMYSSVYELNTLLYPDGNLPVVITAADKAGNSSTFTLSYTVDNSGDTPAVNIIYPIQDKMYNGAVTVSGSAIDDDGEVASVEVQIDINTAPGDSPDFADAIPLSLGAQIDRDGSGSDPAAVVTISGNESALYTLYGTSGWEFTLNNLGKLYDTDGAGPHEGDIYVKVIATDPVTGTLKGEAVRHFILNNNAPTVTITSLPGIDGYINDTSGSIAGNLSGDGNIQLDISLDKGSSWQPVSTFSDPAGAGWTYPLSSWPGGLNPGPVSVYLQAKNNATGLSGFINDNLIMDVEDPVLVSMDPAGGSTVKDTITLRLNINDNGQLALVTRQIGKNGIPVSLGAGNLYSSSVSIDTLTMENPSASNNLGGGLWELPITVVATDKAGNSVTFNRTLTIDNTDNKPIVTIINPQQNGRYNGEVTVTGTATDDDGPVQSVQVRIDLNTPDGGTPDFADTVTIPGGGTIDFDGSGGNAPLNTIDESTWYTVDGTSSWNFVLNSAGNLYSTEAGHTGDIHIEVKAVDNTAQAVESNPAESLHFTLDGTAPKITITSPVIGGYIKDTSGTIDGTVEDNEPVTIQISLDDGAHWRDVTAPPLNSTVTTGTWSYNYSDWTALYGNFPEGAIPIQARVTAGGVTSATNSNVILDSTSPAVEYLTPALGETVNGVVKLKILVSDAGGALDTVTRKVGLNGPVENLPPSELYSSELPIITPDYETPLMAVETPAGSGIWRLPVEVVAADKAGNITTSNTYYFDIDNDGDKPRVSVIYPVDGEKYGGEVSVTGIAQDDDGSVAEVQVRLDLNTAPGGTPNFSDTVTIPNGGTIDFDGSGGNAPVGTVNEGTWYTVSGTSSWTFSLNGAGNLYDTDGGGLHEGDIHVQIRAVDPVNSTLYSTTENLHFSLSNTLPRIDSIKKVEGATVTVLNRNDYISGTVMLELNVSDDSQVDKLEVSFDNGVSWQDLAVTPAPVVSENVSVDTTTAVAGGNGILYLKVRVQDNNSPVPYTTIEFLPLNVDNNAPHGAYTGAMPLVGTAAKLQGEATDPLGSIAGVDYVEVYLERGGLIYNPKNTTYTYAANANAGDIATEQTTFGPGNFYPVNPTGPGVIIINDIDENGNDAGGSGDGDGYNESFTLSGSTRNWWAEINSENIPDGTINVHYVVVDKAGNKTHYVKTDASIANHSPVISQVELGTDVNYSGSVDVTVGNGETFRYIDGSGVNGGGIFYSDFNSSLNGITVRNSRLFVNADALAGSGNGVLSWELYAPGNLGGNLILSGSSATVTSNFPADGAARQYTLRVTDSAGLSDELIILLGMDNTDTSLPAVVLADLNLNHSPVIAARPGADNYGYAVSGYNAAAAPRWTAAASGRLVPKDESIHNGTDADVSGSVIVSGEISDDKALNSLELTITGYNGGSGTGVPFTILDWNTAVNDGLKVASGVTGTPHIAEQSLTESGGHIVKWSFEFDTAAITGTAANNIRVTAVAADKSSNSNTPSNDITLDNYTMDVMPFVTDIVLSNAAYTAENDILRTKLGRWPIRDNSYLIIKGFNLGSTVGTVSSNGAGTAPASLTSPAAAFSGVTVSGSRQS
ncbi:MAG: hypothetical protein CSA76_04805, partial [Spirochaetales bacterium]